MVAMPATERPSQVHMKEALHLMVQDARQPFDLEKGPLIRTTLLNLSPTSPPQHSGREEEEGKYVLLVTMHHIVSDGWSMNVFIRELSTLYKAFVQGQPSPLPELPIQYADFAVWQRDWLQRGHFR